MVSAVRLLGTPSVGVDGVWHEPPPGLPTALLWYLALRGDWVGRGELAFLLWPDVLEASARKNLRNALHRVGALPFAVGLEVERERVRWSVSSDVSDFRAALERGDAAGALDLYRGELLRSVHLDGAPEYERWLAEEREALRERAAALTLERATALEAEERPLAAAALFARLRDDDPFDEALLRRELTALAVGGERRRAQRIYARFAQRLDDEFKVEPEPATSALAAGLPEPSAAADAPAPAPVPPTLSESPAHTLPRDRTPFIGRRGELERLSEQLGDPACRLLTLVAPGGMGKTTLALALAREQVERYPDGVWFVPLAALSSIEQVPSTIVDALGLPGGHRDPREQLGAALAQGRSLLVLDNLEQLDGAGALIHELLEAAPGLTVLATSRERLQLRSEWLFALGGLAFPSERELDAAEAFESVVLFRQGARRLGVPLDGDGDGRRIARLCRLVEGMPLAIELAASWLQTLDLEGIVAEVERGIDLLEATLRDLPERHRSVRAVFDGSWRLLRPALRGVMEALSVFPGSFDRDGARAVAAASARDLLELHGASLLRRGQDGRFDLHPLVRQYARGLLGARATDADAAVARHGEHYLALLRSIDALRAEGRTDEAFDRLTLERPNVEEAWIWGLLAPGAVGVVEIAGLLTAYFVQRVRHDEGSALFDRALARLDGATEGAEASAKLLVAQGWLWVRTGRYRAAESNAARALAALTPADASPVEGEAHNLLGTVAGSTGRFDEARAAFSRAVAVADALDLPRDRNRYLNNLAITEKNLGRFDRAVTLYRRVLAHNRELSEHLSTVRNLNNLGLALKSLGRLDEAGRHLEEGLALAERMGFDQARHHLLASLGNVALELGERDRARTLFHASLRDVRRQRLPVHEAVVLGNLATVATLDGALDEARERLRVALRIVDELGNARLSLTLLAEAARYLQARGEVAAAAEALALIRAHRASDSFLRGRAEALLEAHPDTAAAVAGREDAPDLALTLGLVGGLLAGDPPES